MTDATNIDWSQIGIITGFVVTIGTVFLGIASKIFKFGRVSQRLDHIEKDLDKTIKPELKSLRDTIASETKAINIRLDDILKKLGMKPDEIDLHKPAK